MDHGPFLAGISEYVWDTKYRYRKGGVVQDQSITGTECNCLHFIGHIGHHSQNEATCHQLINLIIFIKHMKTGFQNVFPLKEYINLKPLSYF